MERWPPNSLASRKEKLAGLRPKEAQEQEELEILCSTENPEYTEELLFDEAGGPDIRLLLKPPAESDSSWSAEEAETRYCTECLLFAETEGPRVRLPNKAPKPVPLPAEDDLALLDHVHIPLLEDEYLNLLTPEWIPLSEDDDAELLKPERIYLPEVKDLEFLIPEEISLPSEDDLDLLPDLQDSEDLNLAPKGPTTEPPTSGDKGSRAIPFPGATKAPKAMIVLNARDGPKRGSCSRGPAGLVVVGVVGVRTDNPRGKARFLCGMLTLQSEMISKSTYTILEKIFKTIKS